MVSRGGRALGEALAIAPVNAKASYYAN
jgi:hypothetical protein